MGVPDCASDIYSDLSKCDIKKIDAVVISHLHSDHIGALEKVATDYTVKNLIMPEILSSSIAAAKNSAKLITGYGSASYNAVAGMNFKVGEAEITILGYYNDKSNENNRSLFTMVEIDEVKFLFTGDAETKAEKYILEQKLKLDCDVLKVSHHGSNTSSSKEFLDATTPEYAVISVGEGNMYNHPHNVTLEKLKQANAKIYRTDKQGDITFNVDDGEIKIATEK
jgi:competence protein ComEC